MSEVELFRVLDAQGRFSAPTPVTWDSGFFDVSEEQVARFARAGLAQPPERWITPGFVDAHAHLAWHAFTDEERARSTPEENRRATARALTQNLAAGFTSVRDAGGLLREDVEWIPEAQRPRLQFSGRAINRARADDAGGLDRAVERVLAHGTQWVKLVATASVASPEGAGLEAHFSREELHDAVRRASNAGAGVIVHAWGGPAIDDAIDAGAMSIEHGIFLTDAQAHRAAERGLTFVPTLRIYRLVQDMIDGGSLPASFRARVSEAVGAHPRAVLRARDAGLAMAVGTDSGTPSQHGSGGREIAALVEAGLTPGEALLAATRGGAELLSRVEPGAGAAGAGVGTVAQGVRADAVIFNRDPREPGVVYDPAAIDAVIVGGRVIHPEHAAEPTERPTVI